MSISQLADEMELSERTVYRKIESLQAKGLLQLNGCEWTGWYEFGIDYDQLATLLTSPKQPSKSRRGRKPKRTGEPSEFRQAVKNEPSEFRQAVKNEPSEFRQAVKTFDTVSNALLISAPNRQIKTEEKLETDPVFLKWCSRIKPADFGSLERGMVHFTRAVSAGVFRQHEDRPRFFTLWIYCARQVADGRIENPASVFVANVQAQRWFGSESDEESALAFISAWERNHKHKSMGFTRQLIEQIAESFSANSPSADMTQGSSGETSARNPSGSRRAGNQNRSQP